jgi:hypothetical protein
MLNAGFRSVPTDRWPNATGWSALNFLTIETARDLRSKLGSLVSDLRR